MGPVAHALISAVAAGGVFAATRDPIAAGATFISGTLIDVDHLFDYVRTEGWRMRLTSLRNGDYFAKSGQAFVLLHSYELVLLFCGLSAIIWGATVAVGIAVGAVTHLACDVVFYRFSPVCYSLIHRIRHQFSLTAFRPAAAMKGTTIP